ncbi:hypothetical protein [Streptomyces avermitilis]|uniref:hypothetical protein n=1 Tax=Streptomyces avermitilis TaxID=33903 RepID=UPI003680726F
MGLKDLRNEFYDKIRARGQMPGSEMRLRKQIVKLKELRAADTEELAQLRDDVQGLLRAVNQLTLENQQLRNELTEPRGRLRVLPGQPMPPSPR